MPRHFLACLSRFGGVLVLAGVTAFAQAAELGDVVVRSYAGQPLIADIELTGIVDESVTVQVRPANADVYRGANIRMDPVLASVYLSVMRRDGRQFLHLTSVKPADGDHVHVFLELNDGGRRAVRGVTLWLSPDPTPAPRPAPPQPVAQADEPSPVPAHETPATAAQAPSVAMLAAPTLRARAGAPGACVSQFSAEQIKTCAALDYKNGVLTAQIVELEEKVKALQEAIEGKPAAAAPPPIKAEPAPVHVAPVAKPKPKSTPWLLIGGITAGVLAVVGGLLFFLKKRKGKAKDKPPAADAAAPPKKAGLMARLKQRFARKPKAPADPAADAAAH